MIAVVCVDDNGGVMFNHRRQSKDRILRQDILTEAGTGTIRMNGYSAKQFEPEEQGRLSVAEDFLDQAQPGDFCFVEGSGLLGYEDRLEAVILYKWNRVYPADLHFDLPLAAHGWNLTDTKEFVGSSHEKITREVYKR